MADFLTKLKGYASKVVGEVTGGNFTLPFDTNSTLSGGDGPVPVDTDWIAENIPEVGNIIKTILDWWLDLQREHPLLVPLVTTLILSLILSTILSVMCCCLCSGGMKKLPRKKSRIVSTKYGTVDC